MTNFQLSASATGDVQLISRCSAASFSSVVYIAACNGYLLEAAVSICLQTVRCTTVLKDFNGAQQYVVYLAEVLAFCLVFQP